MRLADFLIALLYDHDCVIIPGFGGLVANYRPARLNRVSNILYPPSKHVGFNRNLIHHDGLLAGKIAQALNISYREAQEQIAETVQAYNRQIAQGTSVVIEKIGIFFRDRNGILQFIPQDQENFLSEAYGLPPVQLRPVSPRIAELHPEKTASAERESDLSAAGLAWWKIAAAITVPLILAGGFLATQQLREKQGFHLASLNPFQRDEVRSAYSPETTTAVFPFLEKEIPNGLLAAAVSDSTQRTFRFDFTRNQRSDSGIEVVWRPAETPAALPTLNVTPARPATAQHTYSVIAGAFAIEENAERLIAELQQKKLPAERAGIRKGLHLVRIGAYASKNEAATMSREALQSAGIKTWVLAR